MKYASFGSISSGTMRNEDLLSTFASELEYHVQNNEWNDDAARHNRDLYLKLVGDARDIGEEGHDDYDSEEASDLVNELIDALQEFAPPYAYFGSHPGDGACYGFWLSDGFAEDFDGIKVNDTSEVADDYDGEVLHVNDHGNITLYLADHGKLTEIWAVV